MVRPSYSTRARKRIWLEWKSSASGRRAPFTIAVLVLAVGWLYSSFYLHKEFAENLKIGLICSCGSYAIWLLGMLVFHALRVPWLLDADAGVLINQQEDRAQTAESSLAKIEGDRQKHADFAKLMEAGVDLSAEIAACHTDAEFVGWNGAFDAWLKTVRQSMQEIGFPTDAVEFVRAGEYAAFVNGVISVGSRQEERPHNRETPESIWPIS